MERCSPDNEEGTKMPALLVSLCLQGVVTGMNSFLTLQLTVLRNSREVSKGKR